MHVLSPRRKHLANPRMTIRAEKTALNLAKLFTAPLPFQVRQYRATYTVIDRDSFLIPANDPGCRLKQIPNPAVLAGEPALKYCLSRVRNRYQPCKFRVEILPFVEMTARHFCFDNDFALLGDVASLDGLDCSKNLSRAGDQSERERALNNRSKRKSKVCY